MGESQVGKSELINALVGCRILPSGGLGPLTAQTLRLRSATTTRVDVWFHGAAHLAALRARLAATGGALTPAGRRRDFGQARLMLTTAAEGEVSEPDVLARLDAAATGTNGQVFPQTIRDRLKTLRGAHGSHQTLTEASAGGARALRNALATLAAGWVSPVIARLEVGVASEVLERVDLVDLPGINVFGDPAGAAAAEFLLTAGLEALVLVVPNKGLSVALSAVLRQTGLLRRLLLADAGPYRRPTLLVAVTHLDDVAKTRRRAPREPGQPPPTPESSFAALEEDTVQLVRKQLSNALRLGRPGADEERLARLVEGTPVIGVAAPDFLILGEGGGESFLRNQASTNIPRLRELLATLADPGRFEALGELLK